MTDISSQHNENSDGEVCENSFDNQIIPLIDSTNNFQEDFYNIFDELSKDDQQGFVSEMFEWTSTNRPY